MDKLKVLRKEKGISQQKLAEQIGTNQQSIHRYEQGAYEPDIRMLKQFAMFFETSIDYLVGNTDVRRKIELTESYDLNEEESSLIDQYRKLSPKARKNIAMMIDILLDS